MSKSGNRQSVSGNGGEVCVHASVCLDSGTLGAYVSVWVQQGDPVDRETVPELEGPSFTTAFASAILFGHQIVIKAIPAC